jgi:hypothetical protein
MPLSFLLTLVTYLAIVAALVRWPNSIAAGIINTLTLGVFLFCLLKAWQRDNNPAQRFWIGFTLFFGVHYLLYFSVHGDMVRLGLADVLGEAVAAYQFERSFNVNEINPSRWWCVHVAQCYVAVAFGLVGGFLSMRMKRTGEVS